MKWRKNSQSYCKRHPGRRKEIDKKHRTIHADKCREQRFKDYWENPEKRRESTRKCNIKNRQKRRDYQKVYSVLNKEKIKAKQRLWVLNNPDKMKGYWAKHGPKRKAILRGATADKKADKMCQVMKTSERCFCYYCRKDISNSQRHIDHVIPISRGGLHTSDNVCVSCPTCNISKHNKKISEWVGKVPQMILSL